MFESPVKQSPSQLPESVRRPVAKLSNVLLILTRRRDLSRSAKAVSAENRKFFPPPFHLAPSFQVTPF